MKSLPSLFLELTKRDSRREYIHSWLVFPFDNFSVTWIGSQTWKICKHLSTLIIYSLRETSWRKECRVSLSPAPVCVTFAFISSTFRINGLMSIHFKTDSISLVIKRVTFQSVQRKTLREEDRNILQYNYFL